MRAIITSVGHYVPERILSNAELEKMVDTSDEWITTRTGIKERRILEEGKASAYMGVEAAKKVLSKRNISANEIDVIIVATVTPDMFFPSTAALIQKDLGADNAWGIDVNGACTGFLYALSTGAMMIESGRYQKILVIGSDKMSSITDYTDRNTCVLFGDAAGAVLLEPGKDDSLGVLDFLLRTDGSGGEYLKMPAGGSLRPATVETVQNRLHYIYQDGKTVFKFAVNGMANISYDILEKHGLKGEDVKFFIPHQANLRIIDAAAKKMKLSPEQVVINIDKYGNTTAATIPLALSEVVQEGKLKKGDIVVMAAFGAGFTWGSLLLKWAMD
ncbi:MAG: ketoacyl-ACP synthase III [Calditrichia bacterium]